MEQIRRNLASIRLWGGIEDSPAALYRATELSLRPGSRRNIIWITDEPYPETSYTKVEIVNRMLAMDITVHGVGLKRLQTEWFDPIVIPTGGKFFDINGNFRDILLEVSRLESQDRYKVTYTSAGAGRAARRLKVEVHYAGLGGEATVEYTPPSVRVQQALLTCYPNPFNPTTKIRIENPDRLRGEVVIYNMLGQRVRDLPIPAGVASRELVWNARTNRDIPLSTGVYFVELRLFDVYGRLHEQEVQRVLYVK